MDKKINYANHEMKTMFSYWYKPFRSLDFNAVTWSELEKTHTHKMQSLKSLKSLKKDSDRMANRTIA